jgi:hypothetical protein
VEAENDVVALPRCGAVELEAAGADPAVGDARYLRR